MIFTSEIVEGEIITTDKKCIQLTKALLKTHRQQKIKINFIYEQIRTI